MKRRPKTFVPFALLLGILLGGLVAWTSGLVVNLTPSLPLGLYLRVDRKTVEVGDLVAVCPPEEAAAVPRKAGLLIKGSCASGTLPLLKRVAVEGGGLVEVRPTGIYLDGSWIQSPAPDVGLTRWPIGRHRLVRDHLWLSADHPRSWDSRFFGPIHRNRVLGIYRPLWTWWP